MAGNRTEDPAISWLLPVLFATAETVVQCGLWLNPHVLAVANSLFVSVLRRGSRSTTLAILLAMGQSFTVRHILYYSLFFAWLVHVGRMAHGSKSLHSAGSETRMATTCAKG